MEAKQMCDWCGDQPSSIGDSNYGTTFCSGRCHEQWLDQIEGPVGLILRNDPPQRRSQSIENSERQRQSVLFSGLNCLPGQQDLFDA